MSNDSSNPIDRNIEAIRAEFELLDHWVYLNSADQTIPARYWRLSRVWNVFGLIATVLPVINLYLMVFRPE